MDVCLVLCDGCLGSGNNAGLSVSNEHGILLCSLDPGLFNAKEPLQQSSFFDGANELCDDLDASE